MNIQNSDSIIADIAENSTSRNGLEIRQIGKRPKDMPNNKRLQNGM